MSLFCNRFTFFGGSVDFHRMAKTGLFCAYLLAFSSFLPLFKSMWIFLVNGNLPGSVDVDTEDTDPKVCCLCDVYPIVMFINGNVVWDNQIIGVITAIAEFGQKVKVTVEH